MPPYERTNTYNDIEMTLRSFLLSLVVAYLFPTNAQSADDHFFIYLCFGQTNMVGHGNLSDAGAMEVENFYSLSAIDGKEDRKLGTWRKALPPLCGPDSGASLVEYFAYTMRRNLPRNIKIGVVMVAVDNCEIDLFDKNQCKAYIKGITDERMKAQIKAYGGNPYERFIKIARQAQKEGEIRGILMHHGETDYCDDRWLEKVDKIYHDIIHDLKLDPQKVPFVVGETVNERNHGKYAHSNVTINKLPNRIPNSLVATSKCCDASVDNVHFTTTGYQLLGVRYAIQMLRGMGMGFEESDNYYTTCDETPQVSKQNMEPIDVDGEVDTKRIFHVRATMPMTRVELYNHKSEVIKTIFLHGETTVDIDLSIFPKNQYPFMEFFGNNGSSVTVELR